MQRYHQVCLCIASSIHNISLQQIIRISDTAASLCFLVSISLSNIAHLREASSKEPLRVEVSPALRDPDRTSYQQPLPQTMPITDQRGVIEPLSQQPPNPDSPRDASVHVDATSLLGLVERVTRALLLDLQVRRVNDEEEPPQYQE